MSPSALSVLLPVLNGAQFLEDALRSLEKQTMTDFVVLVWDNGSTDGTLDILDRWLPKRLPGKVFRGKPQSLGLSLRSLVEEANTELCARMDADDVCQPTRFEKQLHYLKSNPNLALVGTDRECIDIHGKPVGEASSLPHNPTDVLHATLVGPRILHPSVTFRRRDILQAGNYRDESTPEHPYWSEDYDIWMRLQSRALVATLPDRLLLYRINPDGVTQMAIKQKRAAQARRRVWERHSERFTGLNTSTALQLHDRKLKFALPAICRVAKHFSKLDSVSVPDRLICRSFVEASEKLICSKDLIARVWLKLARSISL